MRKSFAQRLADLEALEHQRCTAAISTALAQLTSAESDAFSRYWHRSKNQGNVWPEGDEIAAVARYEELVIQAYETT